MLYYGSVASPGMIPSLLNSFQKQKFVFHTWFHHNDEHFVLESENHVQQKEGETLFTFFTNVLLEWF